jgi:hypothetical protein
MVLINTNTKGASQTHFSSSVQFWGRKKLPVLKIIFLFKAVIYEAVQIVAAALLTLIELKSWSVNSFKNLCSEYV